MKYWICVESDGTQGLPLGVLVKSKDEPDTNWGSFVWAELSKEQYEKLKNGELNRGKLLGKLRSSMGYTNNFKVYCGI